MRRLLMLLLVVQSASAVPMPTPVYTDTQGREWVDLVDTSWRSYVDVVNVCSSATGYCEGVLEQNNFSGIYSPDVDLTGFTWATLDDVKDLFNEVGGLPAGSLDTGHVTFDWTDGYGANFFDHFEFTLAFFNGPYSAKILNGFTRDLKYDAERGLVAPLGTLYSTNYDYDYFNLDFGGWSVQYADPSIGVYVYRVPEPGTLGLFVMGLFGIAISLRGKRMSSR